ncbi:MAG: DEAD/DEAH box helicase family protein [Bacteroidota bacterium]
MSKRDLSEIDICDRYITPALHKAGWSLEQIRREYPISPGRIHAQGAVYKRGTPRRADYLLFYKNNLPLAVIEAKDNKHTVGHGIQQAVAYGDMLDVPFVYSSNGDAFLERDVTGPGGVQEKQIGLDAFPSPETLWQRYQRFKGITEEQTEAIEEEYYTELDGKEPRYYQRIAINRVVEAVARGDKRLLLVMATGTGKTFTAFQIMWRLKEAGQVNRILFLADRNILVDQAKTNDFRPFGDIVTKFSRQNVDKSFEIFLALYQSLTGPNEADKAYRKFSKDFFDLIVIDECHRGSAKEDSEWREILEYFDSAVQLGLTATPKETKYVSNIDYFGKPVYTYSLKQGIDDGFLAPYRVIRINLDRDLEGWRPEKGRLDINGNPIEDRIYNRKDFDRTLVIEERTLLVAHKVSEYLKKTDRYAKTIVFCIDIKHADRMRHALVNENGDKVAENGNYVMKITGDDMEGKRELDTFIDPESTYPTIVTTSKLLTTGVDAQTCKVIVLDSNIGSMTEFKQIIGRGTRIREDYGKHSFTIIDFRGVTNLFADPDFDGEPVQIYIPGREDPITPPEPDPVDTSESESEDEDGRQYKYHVDNVEVKVVNERVQYYGPDGKLITESLRDYSRKNLRKSFASLDDFLQHWSSAQKKETLLAELLDKGIFYEALAEEVGKDLGPFDLICHVAYDQPALTRQERAENVRKRNYFAKYGDQARQVLEALLDKYADQGVEQIEKMEVLKVHPISQLGSPIEIVRHFGGKKQFLQAVRELEREIYTLAS